MTINRFHTFLKTHGLTMCRERRLNMAIGGDGLVGHEPSFPSTKVWGSNLLCHLQLGLIRVLLIACQWVHCFY